VCHQRSFSERLPFRVEERRVLATNASRVIDPKGAIVCDTGATEGLVMWSTDILIDVRTP